MNNELRTEIQKLLEDAPEVVLQAILRFLKESRDQSSDQLRLSHHLPRILEEDDELLRKLA